MKHDAIPFVRDLLLVGAGHANVHILRDFGMRPEPGVRLTVVARESHSPYSGMLPGYLYGKYSWEEIHIDVAKLSAFANARFIKDEVVALDPEKQLVSFQDRPDLRYDCLACNTGGEPGIQFRAQDNVTPVKPIGNFTTTWDHFIDSKTKGVVKKLAVVGGGPGSVEVALAIRERYGSSFNVTLITADPEILVQHNKSVRRHATTALRKFNVSIVVNYRVSDITEDYVISSEGKHVQTDHVLWVANVEAPSWIQQSGFDVDKSGFMKVNQHLRSLSHSNVFAGGDMVCLVGQERPKSGVYAVRAGPILSHNVRSFLTNRSLKPYRAQRKALAILQLPNNEALASKGGFCLKAKTIGRWKHRIDLKFMTLFGDLPQMKNTTTQLDHFDDVETLTVMRCGGCGAKLGADILTKVLRRLSHESSGNSIDINHDDASILEMGSNRLATSCDQFRAMISDPYRFGKISANHALNDLYAMGSKPKYALALITLPLMSQPLMEDELYQTMSGALSVFREAGVTLVGGHSAEGRELSVGFTVMGDVDNQPLMKSALELNQELILTKPIGTGLLLAGAMQMATPAMHLIQCIEIMEQSNMQAAAILRANGATAMTDVTGFGLVGHLAEMIRQSSVQVRLSHRAVPQIAGVADVTRQGIKSSLHPNNAQTLADFEIGEGLNEEDLVALVDPQTSGGLLASVPVDQVSASLEAIKQAGYHQASSIGQTIEGQQSQIVLD